MKLFDEIETIILSAFCMVLIVWMLVEYKLIGKKEE